MIQLQQVSKSFRRDGVTKHILHDVTFTLPPDRNIAILGRNGAGKSTLLRLVAGTLRPDRGRVVRDVRVSWPMGFSGSFHPALSSALSKPKYKIIIENYFNKIAKSDDSLTSLNTAFSREGDFINIP
jgi:ABC-type polysaccharide/polyol phosphate transport system ATPase subunit